jgi:uncharacterized protein
MPFHDRAAGQHGCTPADDTAEGPIQARDRPPGDASVAGDASRAPVVVAPAPIPPAERSLAPDIARGLLLMFIAIANIVGFHLGIHNEVSEPSFLDRVVAGIEGLFVRDRSRPMFAILFGFGVAMMASRLAARGLGVAAVRRILRRRSLWLILLGVVHAVFLWHGDILGSYGATCLIALMLVHRDDHVLRRWFWGSAALQLVGAFLLYYFLVSDGDGGGAPNQRMAYSGFMIEGLMVETIFIMLSLVFLLFLALVIVGFWLFRSGWLMRPEDHLPSLRRAFWVAMAVNVVVSVPAALLDTEVWRPGHLVTTLVHTFCMTAGGIGGFGYICGFALLAVRWKDRGRTGLPGVLAAVGERSLTAYLSQSVVFFTVVTGFGLGMASHLGTAGDAAVAIAGWGVIAVGMAALARLGLRGPFEVLLRRLTYQGVRGRAFPGRKPRHRDEVVLS